MYRVSIIGSGKVGWQLAQALENRGHYIGEVWSRNPENAAALVDHLYDARVQDQLDFSQSHSQVFLLAVADKAVAEVARQLLLPSGAILAHTSGTLPMDLLKPATDHYGVFYPLQTFSKEKEPAFDEIPFCLEATDRKTLKDLKKLAGSLSKTVYELDGPKRKSLHLAAVFACNFTNHMLRVSEELLKADNIDPHLLHPLVSETIQKNIQIGAARAQTGPALREDMQVLASHLEQLESHPKWAELYYLISQDIIKLKEP